MKHLPEFIISARSPVQTSLIFCKLSMFSWNSGSGWRHYKTCALVYNGLSRVYGKIVLTPCLVVTYKACLVFLLALGFIMPGISFVRDVWFCLFSAKMIIQGKKKSLTGRKGSCVKFLYANISVVEVMYVEEMACSAISGLEQTGYEVWMIHGCSISRLMRASLKHDSFRLWSLGNPPM